MSDDDQSAKFRALVVPELAYLRRLGLALTGNAPTADDLVQESVLRALRYFHSYQGDGFRAWMAAIMRNLQRDRAMTGPGAGDDDFLQNLPDSAPGPEQLAINKDSARRLRMLVAALPETLREVLVLREFGDLSYAQIGAALKMPAGTVMSRLSRAREHLREVWFTGSGAAP